MKTSNILTSKTSYVIYLIVVTLTSLFIAVQMNVKDTSALSPSDFNPGRIIDDAVFYNSNSMTAQQIQTFLNERMPNCDTNGTGMISYYYNPNNKYVSYGTWQSGASWVTTTRAVYGERAYQYRMSVNLPDNGSRAPYSCLKDYRMNTPQQPAASGGLCSQINAMTNASAAQIIKAVADACGINPQVILVILEKEQSLVQGDNWPFGTRYSHAMGYACPDTAACDVNYEGLFKQIYHGAKQYKIYQKYPNDYNYRAGQNNIILYNPDSRCGTSTVFIENQATAGLYIYTPYQPNQATINWKLGSGGAVSSSHPGCGAFGNINFFMLFSNWFGSTMWYKWDSMLQPRVMVVKSESFKIYPQTDKIDTYRLMPGIEVLFTSKTTLPDGSACLRTNMDTELKELRCVPISLLEEFKPEFTHVDSDNSLMTLTEPTCRLWYTSNTIDCSHSQYLDFNMHIEVAAKVSVLGKTFYITKHDFNNQEYRLRGISEDSIKQSAQYKPISPVYMRLNSDIHKESSVNNGEFYFVPKDSVVQFSSAAQIDGRDVYRTTLDTNSGVDLYINDSDLSSELFIPFMQPRDLKVSDKQRVVSEDIVTGEICASLNASSVFTFTTKTTLKGDIFFRTISSTNRNSNCAIKATDLVEVY